MVSKTSQLINLTIDYYWDQAISALSLKTLALLFDISHDLQGKEVVDLESQEVETDKANYLPIGPKKVYNANFHNKLARFIETAFTPVKNITDISFTSTHDLLLKYDINRMQVYCKISDKPQLVISFIEKLLTAISENKESLANTDENHVAELICLCESILDYPRYEKFNSVLNKIIKLEQPASPFEFWANLEKEQMKGELISRQAKPNL